MTKNTLFKLGGYRFKNTKAILEVYIAIDIHDITMNSGHVGVTIYGLYLIILSLF